MEITATNRYDIAPETKLWRYMSFAKFISMLNSSKLLYIPAFRFNDPFEGACGIAQGKQTVEEKSRRNKDREYTFISCWHENELESEAMWKLYTQFNQESVAIQTTYKRLKEETKNYPYVRIGRVSYVNYDQKLNVPDSYFWYKRKSFEHEREVRVMTVSCPVTNIELFEKMHPGRKLTRMIHPISLDNLIENVYISPMAPRWFREVVKEELIKHKLSIDPIYSVLNAEPEFDVEI